MQELFDSGPWVTKDRDAWLIIEPYAITWRRLTTDDQGWAFHEDAYL
jgi:hypothetical protein